MFQERTSIEHTPRDYTRVLENDEPPPVPKIFTQSYKDRRKKRCKHPNAVFKGFYQFSRGDEASRKYWWCPDCGQVFRFSGRMNVKSKRRIINSSEEEKSKEKSK
jgi:DNA-directed RNA polymerase subunit M/transcription elongation factor TFIIS